MFPSLLRTHLLNVVILAGAGLQKWTRNYQNCDPRKKEAVVVQKDNLLEFNVAQILPENSNKPCSARLY